MHRFDWITAFHCRKAEGLQIDVAAIPEYLCLGEGLVTIDAQAAQGERHGRYQCQLRVTVFDFSSPQGQQLLRVERRRFYMATR